MEDHLAWKARAEVQSLNFQPLGQDRRSIGHGWRKARIARAVEGHGIGEARFSLPDPRYPMLAVPMLLSVAESKEENKAESLTESLSLSLLRVARR
jgi:hypothetical protein